MCNWVHVLFKSNQVGSLNPDSYCLGNLLSAAISGAQTRTDLGLGTCKRSTLGSVTSKGLETGDLVLPKLFERSRENTLDWASSYFCRATLVCCSNWWIRKLLTLSLIEWASNLTWPGKLYHYSKIMPLLPQSPLAKEIPHTLPFLFTSLGFTNSPSWWSLNIAGTLTLRWCTKLLFLPFQHLCNGRGCNGGWVSHHTIFQK